MRGIQFVLVLVIVCLAPSASWAQAVLAGDVNDAAGAAAEDVLVEAQSEALIERVRSTRSNASGRYRIEGLRPGNYVVTFSRSGFKTTTVQDVQLTGTRTVVVRVALEAGAPNEP